MKQIIGILMILMLVGCTQIEQPTGPTSGTDQTFEEEGIIKFSSGAELAKFLGEQALEIQSIGFSGRGMTLGADMAVMEKTAVMDTVVESVPAAIPSDSGADEYSQTNVQVKGVDEADFVKNDGKYIYMLSGNKLVIVDAYPADDAEIVYEDEISGNARNLFINEDKLILFVDDSEEIETYSEYDFMPRNRYVSVTKVMVYDISDRSEPKEINEYSVNGGYYDARMIGDHVYFVAKDSLYYRPGWVDVPVIRENGVKVLTPEIYYFGNPEDNYVLHTVAAFDVNGQDINAKTFMMGYSNTMMVSLDNIYIAYQKNLPYSYYKDHNEDRFYKVVVPLLPSSTQTKINLIKNNDQLNSYEKWDEITKVLETMYNNMDEGDKDKLIEKIEEAVEAYEAKLAAERRKTVIHKINIGDGEIEYGSSGEVNGYLLNQFSMDEFEGNLRVATTTYVYRADSTMYNNVYVLDDDMEVVGSLEDVAPDERIYSARFIGDRLYMVTFKNIDPFFVIDLSDATNPNILGELKIPGYSDYLHPYDENHIIGIGKETEGNQWGGVSVGGVKVALFDVSDVSSPEMVDKFEIGEEGTESEALHEHKAFLFDKDKGIIVLPIRETTGRVYDETYGYYKWDVWQGAYVLDIDPEGVGLRGKVEHASGDDRYYWGSPNAVRRSLYMDDVLYTISGKKIVMSDLEDVEEVNEVKLPYEEDYPRPYIVY